MKYITLRDLSVSRIGLGAMGMSHGYTGAGSGTKRVSRVEENTVADGI